MRRMYHSDLLAAARYYRTQADRLAPVDPRNFADATRAERQAYNLRYRAAELEHHVSTCPAAFHLVEG